jgi:O-acetyl-ADP-ribose deacetylase (regulator of RNase III)
MKVKINGVSLEFVEGDITEMDVKAIVNAANSGLIMGGGVAGAIRKKGGPTIQEECNRIGHCPVGSAVITAGGRLKANFVIHAVGPRWGEGNEDEKLTSAVKSVLEVAKENNIKTLAMPAISAGIFGFPMERCAKIMISTALEWLEKHNFFERIVFCLYGSSAFNTFAEEFSRQVK